MIKTLKDKVGNELSCGFCKKALTDKDEIEYSREHCEFYCCSEHAAAQYFENEGSKPIEFDEAQKNINSDIVGWDVM